MSQCQKLELNIDRTKLIDGAIEVTKRLRSHWSVERMEFKVFDNGRTNQLVRVHYDNDQTDTILVRVYGENTEHIIDRQNEINIMQLFNTIGLSSKIYAVFTNGLAYQYLCGKIFDESLCCHSSIFPLVAEKMAKFHLQLPMYLEFSGAKDKTILWDKIYSFIASSDVDESSMKDSNNKFKIDNKSFKGHRSFPSKASLFKELEWLTCYLEKCASSIVLCHNDLLLDNILFDEGARTVHFIDFEYAGPNYAAYDIANHFNEISGYEGRWSTYPDVNFRRRWLEVYLKMFYNCQRVDESKLIQLLEEVENFRLASHFFCGTWGFYQVANSKLDVDFTEYTVLRFEEYFRVKNALISSSNSTSSPV